MKHFIFFLAAMLMNLSQASAAGKPCEELKAEIAAKLTSKGVKNYELKIFAKSEAAEGKVVGLCEDGSKKINYIKQTTSFAADVDQKQAVQVQLTQHNTTPEKIELKQPVKQTIAPKSATKSNEEQVPVVTVKMIQVAPKSNSAVKSCEELKAEIAAKLTSKGLKNYELTVSAQDKAAGKIVGTCENGSKKIFYIRK